ncbi:MAG: CYTH domain-containing protein [Bacteroidales bacterium]|nr:CYTH domain-containing protein [Bacteroidales bacterium]
MPKEIERKFLVTNDSYMANSEVHHIIQGYICSENDRVVRIRIYDNDAFLTIKNATIGFSRDEFEYHIPLADAETMLRSICQQPIIEKYRYKFIYEGFIWEIDHFEGDNNGLVIAEIELPNENTTFTLPPFIGKEVTGDTHYYNACLNKHPFNEWKDEHLKNMGL